MTELFEALMVISFGLSWPISILKAYRSRTAKGRSIVFSFLICFGYICGIVSKLTAASITYVFTFYVLNLAMVSIDILLYFRIRKLDRKAEVLI